MGNGVDDVLRHRKPASLYAAAAIGLVAAAALGGGYAWYHRAVTAEQAAALRSERANADLQQALARLRDQLGAADQALNTAQSRISSLNDEVTSRRNEMDRQLAVSEQASTSKADRISQLARALEQAQRELHLAEAQRVTLLARLSKAEAELTEGQARQSQTQASTDQLQKKIQQLMGERDKAVSERDQFRAKLIEKQSMQHARSQPAVAQAAPAPATPAAAAAPVAMAAPAVAAPSIAAAPAAAPAVAQAVPRPAPVAAVAVNRGGFAQLERVLASAGVDVTHLFAQYGVRTGEGGPFIPVSRGARADTSLTPEKLTALRNMVKALPVSAPLESYEVGSGFGVRGDPMNGHAGFHTGIDLRAPYMTPVYATAGGVVTYSGYRDDYGKVVEIDHGNGIATRYAHLHRATVSVGQRIAAHSQIGFLGSTGRATGPHVHYEVLVNGEPHDPARFIGLAHVVPAVLN